MLAAEHLAIKLGIVELLIGFVDLAENIQEICMIVLI